VQVDLCTDEFGRLTCALADEQTAAVVTASDPVEARTGLLAALDKVRESGMAECFWHESMGEYRWVFRRDGDRLRVAVLWSAGTVTGWEHVFWTECDPQAFDGAMRAEIFRG
jgi:hypothetical protein